ncbi:MAG: hypothetical protein ABI810_08095 [Sphingomonas bacterium]
MGGSDDHPLIAFAGRFGDPAFDYLNAAVAIARADDLLRDLYTVARLIEAETPEDRRWAPWFGAEAISYYAVGFVTCLEWHAKSRLIDLLAFRPASLTVADVDRTINAKLIVQMVARKASVTQLVGAALKVNNLGSYLRVAERLFADLELPCSVKDWLTGMAKESTVCWLREDQFATIEGLFRFRHMLVHEIGIATMGHPNVRDAWWPDRARETGAIVASLICGIEAALTRFAPALFPNLLDEQRWPVDPADTLYDEMNRLDGLVQSAMIGRPEQERTRQNWDRARARFTAYLAAEKEFVATADVLGWRYLDARRPLRLRALTYRIGFLEELLSRMNVGDDYDPLAGQGI